MAKRLKQAPASACATPDPRAAEQDKIKAHNKSDKLHEMGNVVM
jgi:hypothetical protein